MFYKDKIESKESELKTDLINKRIFTRGRMYQPDIPCVPIELEELQKTQQRILEYLNVELKTTPSKTELVKKQ